MSDVQLLIAPQDEYNTTRTNFAERRRQHLPVRVVRMDGNLLPQDVIGQGWMSFADDKITLVTDVEPLVYEVKRTSGIDRCHDGKRIPIGDAATQEQLRTGVGLGARGASVPQGRRVRGQGLARQEQSGRIRGGRPLRLLARCQAPREGQGGAGRPCDVTARDFAVHPDRSDITADIPPTGSFRATSTI
jgi:hypothetical protein